MTKVYVWYVTSTKLEKHIAVDTKSTCINLDLQDMAYVDLLPLIWCTHLEDLNLRDNKLQSIDLTPLSNCVNLQSLRLGNNQLESINLTPLGECSKLEELALKGNKLKRIDISPLFHCPNLTELKIDETVTLVADLTLKSVGSWPEVLVERFHRILWKVPETT
ncbi:MAG: leucine-rich repeat domain-containing protein [Candidatus Hodarchaeota archaeon]